MFLFSCSPSRGRRGLRSAWGGEIGGAGVDRLVTSGLPRLVVNPASRPSTCAGGKRSKSPRANSPDTRLTSPDLRHEQLNKRPDKK